MKVLIAGDLHMYGGGADKLVRLADKLEYDLAEIWQVGDLGYWPGRSEPFFDILDQSPVPIYFADGNHENHHSLGSGDPDLQPRHVSEKVTHQPRGTVREVEGRRVMFFGGAHSVDRIYRKANVDWFSEEAPNYAEWDRAQEAGEVDIMVTHEAPSVVELDYPPIGRSQWPANDLHRAEGHRRGLTRLLESAKPELWFHGHHHDALYANLGPLRVLGLDCDGHPGTFALLDLESLFVRYVTMQDWEVRGVKPDSYRNESRVQAQAYYK